MSLKHCDRSATTLKHLCLFCTAWQATKKGSELLSLARKLMKECTLCRLFSPSNHCPFEKMFAKSPRLPRTYCNDCTVTTTPNGFRVRITSIRVKSLRYGAWVDALIRRRIYWRWSCMSLQSTTWRNEAARSGARITGSCLPIQCSPITHEKVLQITGALTKSPQRPQTMPFMTSLIRHEQHMVRVGVDSASFNYMPFAMDRLDSAAPQDEAAQRETDRRWAFNTIFRRFPLDVEPCLWPLYGRRDRSSVWTTRTQLRVGSWKHCTVLTKDDDTHVFGCKAWLHLRLDSQWI